MHIDKRPLPAIHDRRRLVGARDDAPLLVKDEDRGDLRQVRELIVQPRCPGGDLRRGAHALHVAQNEIDRLEAARRLLDEEARDVRDIALHVAEGALAVGERVPHRRADIDGDQHHAERDQHAHERQPLERRSQPPPQHRLQSGGPISSDTAVSSCARRTGFASARAAPADSASSALTPLPDLK